MRQCQRKIVINHNWIRENFMDEKKKFAKAAVTALKGIWVGATMLVPGVSGGSMAMILGIYDRLVAAVSTFLDKRKADLVFLCVFCTGAAAGMLLFAKPILGLLERYTLPVTYFFLGAVAGGIPLILKKSTVKKPDFWTFLYPAAGVILVLVLAQLPAGSLTAEAGSGLLRILLLAAAGAVAAVALVLPGISVSYLLLVLGLYQETMKAIGKLDLAFLLPLAIGLIGGILLFTKVLEKAMERYPKMTYLMILGFMLGSLGELYPGLPKGENLLPSIILFGAGFAVIRLIDRENKGAEEENIETQKENLAESPL